MKFYGVKQGCQDVICPGTAYNWVPEEMKKCHHDKADAIHSCCEDECGRTGLGQAYEDCMSSCYTPKPKKEMRVNVAMVSLLSLFIIGIFVSLFLFT